MLSELTLFKKLAKIRLINKGAFFNIKLLTKSKELNELGIWKDGYTLKKVTEDTSKMRVEFKLPFEDLERTLELTFFNYITD